MVSELERLVKAGRIGEYEKCTIIDMCKRVLEKIASKYEKVRKGVRKVMGGQILEYEAKTILNKGKEEGRKEGKEEGRKKERNSYLNLTIKLFDAGREADLKKASENPSYLEQLYKEFNIDSTN